MKSQSTQLTLAIAFSVAFTGLFALSTGAPSRNGVELQFPAFTNQVPGPLAAFAR